MIRKIGLFFLSLWLFFILAIVITVDIPVCFSPGCTFIGFKRILSTNIIPCLFLICLLVATVSYYDFSYKLKDATNMPFRISKIEAIDYEHLTFLTTYIVPLICFNLVEIRFQIVLFILLTVIGFIYIRTDLFYANPTLAILNYRIYRVDGVFKQKEERKNIIIISRTKLDLNQRVDYIKLDERIYYGKPKTNG